jgi:O-antigen/teichoic acid export membrane protein
MAGMAEGTKHSIRYNFIMNTLIQGSSWLVPFLVRPFVSRTLLKPGMGRVQFSIGILYYFVLFATLGIPTYGIRECAQARKDPQRLQRSVREILCINLVTGLIAYVLYFAYVFSPLGAEYRTLLLVISPAIALNVINVDWLYKGLEDFRTIAVRNVIVKAVSAALILLLVRNASHEPVFAFLSIVSSYGVGLWNFAGAWGLLRRMGGAGEKSGETLRIHPAGHLRAILVFLGMSAATAVYTQLDIVMLGILTEDGTVGIYDAAAGVKVLLVAAVSALGAVLLPRVSALLQEGRKEEFYRISRKALFLVVGFGVCLMLAVILCRKPIILLVSGPDFAGADAVLGILALTVPLIGYTNITGMQMLVPLGRERTVLASEIAGAVCDFVLNLLLIPRYGAAGAAVATVIAEAVVALVQTIGCRRELRAALF